LQIYYSYKKWAFYLQVSNAINSQHSYGGLSLYNVPLGFMLCGLVLVACVSAINSTSNFF